MGEEFTTLKISADELTAGLLALDVTARLALLDSCGRKLSDSKLLIAGIDPTESFEFDCQTQSEAVAALQFLDRKLEVYQLKQNPLLPFGGGICVVTLAYEFGLLLENLQPRVKEFGDQKGPSATFSFYETFVVHNYESGTTEVVGRDAAKLAEIIRSPRVSKSVITHSALAYARTFDFQVSSNFTKNQYLARVEQIKKHIALGNIYQANLTQQLSVRLPENISPAQIFGNLRKSHPAPFAAFLQRHNDCVVSASPENFFQIKSPQFKAQSPIITVSPIKGTRRRGANKIEDELLRDELINSAKDQAENVMIVDLLRNDLGRVCKFGTVKPEKLFEIETHESLFHLVSTVRGELRKNIKTSDLLTALFPCGSITGAPKVRAMQILDEIEIAPRGLSMGAIGYLGFDNSADFSVAIRTMIINNRKAVFNVGGGIVTGSQPEAEYDESWLKAQALLRAICAPVETI